MTNNSSTMGMTMDFLELIKPNLTAIDFDSITTVKAKSCRAFKDLVESYRSHMTVTQSIEDCLAVCCGIHIATKMDGDPLWMYLVGAPSSGKSTLCELLCADEYNSRPLSKFTGLISGSKQGSHLIPYLHGRCVIVKYGTLLLESTPAQLANVYGELRDIFDGSIEARYRNGVEASFKNISFGLIIGITEKIYGLNMSALGERFLHCRLETERVTELQRNRTAIESVFGSTSRTMAEDIDNEEDQRSFPIQRGYTAGFLNHLHSKVSNEEILRPTYTDDDTILIQDLADIIACSRAQAPKDLKDNIMYDSRPESSTRVVKQLARLALALCYVYSTNRITDNIRRVIRKVALDTAFSRQYHVIKAISNSRNGLTRKTISSQTGLEYENCRKIILDLLSLEIVQEISNTGNNKVGVTPSLLVLPDWIKESFTRGSRPKVNQTRIPKKVSKVSKLNRQRQVREDT